MKKCGLSRWFLISMLVISAAKVMPDESHYEFTVSGDKATVTGYTGPGGDITVPHTLAGYIVTTIGRSAFSYSESLTSVVPL